MQTPQDQYKEINDHCLKVNKTKTIYLAYDCELLPCKISDNLFTIRQYCKNNHCSYSTYPPGTYTERQYDIT